MTALESFYEHIQAYTPFTKPLIHINLIKGHPFLITYLLGQNFINYPKFSSISLFSDKLFLYNSLKEAVENLLSPGEVRFEFVISADTIFFLIYQAKRIST